MAGLLEFAARFATEERCIEHLAGRRWPGGFVCIGCGGRWSDELALGSVNHFAPNLCNEKNRGGSVPYGTRRARQSGAHRPAPDETEGATIAFLGNVTGPSASNLRLSQGSLLSDELLVFRLVDMAANEGLHIGRTIDLRQLAIEDELRHPSGRLDCRFR